MKDEKEPVSPTAPPPPHVRIGCVPYLNSKVLVYGLEPRGPGYTLEFHPPSVLAKKLQSGEVEVGLVSSIEYFRHAEYRMLPGLSVSGRDEMWSIRLFHRVPIESLRRVALDPASETTNALLRIILEERHGLAVEYVKLEAGEDPVSRQDLDGCLKIGDPALAFREPGFEALDLQREWRALTHLPFVFAVWLTRQDTQLKRLDELLSLAKEAGLKNARKIADLHHREAGLTRDRALEYVTKIVHYGLGEEERAGLARFGEYLEKLGIILKTRSLQFLTKPKWNFWLLLVVGLGGPGLIIFLGAIGAINEKVFDQALKSTLAPLMLFVSGLKIYDIFQGMQMHLKEIFSSIVVGLGTGTMACVLLWKTSLFNADPVFSICMIMTLSLILTTLGTLWAESVLRIKMVGNQGIRWKQFASGWFLPHFAAWLLYYIFTLFLV